MDRLVDEAPPPSMAWCPSATLGVVLRCAPPFHVDISEAIRPNLHIYRRLQMLSGRLEALLEFDTGDAGLAGGAIIASASRRCRWAFRDDVLPASMAASAAGSGPKARLSR